MENVEKSTHEAIYLWQPVIKSSNGKYIAVLSDDSIDRDDEIVGKEALTDIMKNDGYTAILLNHKNDVLMQIGEWTEKRIEEVGGTTAFVCEPKFYMSNPNAQIIKGCMDEGAQYGVSIGAIPLKWETRKGFDGKDRTVYTKLELLEASFVAIPANKHGRAMAVAKMFNANKVKTMEMEELQKSFDSLNLAKSDLEKKFEEQTLTVNKLNLDLEQSKKDLDKAIVDKESLQKDFDAKIVEFDKVSKELEDLKKSAVLKGDMSTVEYGDGSTNTDISKAMDAGSLPVMRR